jgi:large subunit ribosomal protein L17
MRHGKKINHLGRTASHRKAMLSNMATSLFVHKRITTTVAKAKALRKYVEPLVTKAKNDTTHSRRIVFSYLQDKESTKVLFNEIVQKVGDRPGGYTRIIKLGSRPGDNAEMCLIELVDYNSLLLEESAAGGAKKKRTRRKKSSTSTEESTDEPKETTPKAEAKKQEAPKAEAKKEEAPKAEAKADVPKAEKTEAKKEETPKAEAKKEEAPEAKADDKGEEKKSDTEESGDDKKEK